MKFVVYMHANIGRQPLLLYAGMLIRTFVAGHWPNFQFSNIVRYKYTDSHWGIWCWVYHFVTLALPHVQTELGKNIF